MAREDTKWFIAGVVVLSIVLFLALPISMLVVIDYMKMKSELKHEIKEVRKLKEEVRKEMSDVANSSGNRSESDQ